MSSNRPRRTAASQGRTVDVIFSSDDGEGLEVVGGGNGDRGRPEFGPKADGGCGSNGDFGSQFPANPMAAARGTGRGR